MKTTSYYPVIQVADVPATARFYTDHFRFKPLFDAEWYVHLQSLDDPSVNLAVLRFDHETIPAQARYPSRGVILNFEVADPDAIHARVLAAGLPIVKPLCDEDFGQRHFLTCDPNGILIDVIKPIEPSAAFADQYLSPSAS